VDRGALRVEAGAIEHEAVRRAIGPPDLKSARSAISLNVTTSPVPCTPTTPPGLSSRSAGAHSIISAAWRSICSRISTVATATARPVM
jgi:hypothetical protein